MRPLYHYIQQTLNKDHVVNLPVIDGHCHTFSHRGPNPCTLPVSRSVSFADIELDCLSEYKDLPGMYSKYIGELDPSKHSWCATGLDIDTIKTIYKEHSDVIVGFGELKLYDVFNGKDVKFKRISFAHEVCRFSEQVGSLPVFIHYEITSTVESEALKRLCNKFPDVPVVLCHCGMNESNQQFAFDAVRNLVATSSNLWLDISWDAAKWLAANPMLITQLPLDRLIWGSDTSPRLQAHGFKSATLDDIKSWESAVVTYFDSDKNIHTLFNENTH
jgi:hypothetical protein